MHHQQLVIFPQNVRFGLLTLAPSDQFLNELVNPAHGNGEIAISFQHRVRGTAEMIGRKRPNRRLPFHRSLIRQISRRIRPLYHQNLISAAADRQFCP